MPIYGRRGCRSILRGREGEEHQVEECTLEWDGVWECQVEEQGSVLKRLVEEKEKVLF